jgi:hypothetical protein
VTTRVACPDCRWTNTGEDAGSVRHSAIVHNTILHPGHHAAEIEPRVQARRDTIMHRALHNPDGLPPWKFTQGMTKADALQFWVDAHALGLVRVGTTTRGAKLYALPSYEVPAPRGPVKP